MLDSLSQQTSERKLRLFACACVRRIWHLLTESACRRLVEMAERHADGLASDDELLAAYEQARRERICRHWQQERTKRGQRQAAAAKAAWDAAANLLCDSQYLRVKVQSVVAEAAMATGGARTEEAAQAALLREVFGNPFRPVVVDPGWLTWNDGTVPRIAQAMYDDRSFDHLPILADALEDAGCTDPALLAHCRAPGKHIRGCWAADLLLGKT
jgi:hypothetical protein